MRSWLFVPGDSERKIEKALASPADVVILDLEDSVAPDNKPAARKIVAETLANRPETTAHVYVRVNPLDSALTDIDLEALKAHYPDGFMLPKTNTGKDVQAFDRKLAVQRPIIAIATETAASLFHLGTYDNLDANLAAMTWGAEDLSNALGATTARDDNGNLTEPYRLARNLCLAGARAAGVEPIDSVYTSFTDMAGLDAEARAAARDGFTGKMAIHPAQVPVINKIFTPSGAEIKQAKAVVEAFAQAGDAGVVAIGGQMYDIPHLKRAEKLLQRARLLKSQRTV
jgi:citrate lyase subunit beta/citryl-CoA lyase